MYDMYVWLVLRYTRMSTQQDTLRQTHRPGEDVVHPFEVLGAHQDVVQSLHPGGHNGLIVRASQTVHGLCPSKTTTTARRAREGSGLEKLNDGFLL